MSSPLFVVDLIKKTFGGIFTLARLTKVPGLGRLIEYGLFEDDDILFLPRDRAIRIDRPFDGRKDMVLPSQVVDRFISKAGVRWIMNSCICREASNCQDYPIDLGCLFLGEAAEGINPALGRKVSVNEALAHVRRCREAGLVHLIGRNKLDAVWLNVRPGRKLLTICNCCPCCCLWRILPFVSGAVAGKTERLPGVTVTVTDRCQGCGLCTQGVCFTGALRLESQRAVIGPECRGCGRCVDACPHQAIELKIDRPDAVDLAVERLTTKVDVT